MPQVLYPTSTSASGLIIISNAQLESLEKLLLSEKQRLDRLREEAITAQIAEATRLDKDSLYDDGDDDESAAQRRERYARTIRESWDRRHPSWVSVEVQLKNGRKIQATSIAELGHHPELENSPPTSLTVEVISGEVRIEVGTSTSLFSSTDLKARVHPDSSEDARMILAKLEDWMHGLRYRFYINWWANTPAFIIWLLVIMLMVMLVAINFASRYHQPYIEKAHKLLAGEGVTQGNLPEAIEILLALESSYGIIRVQSSPSIFVWVVIFSTLSIATLLSIRPSGPVIGLGRWQRSAEGWHKYTQTIFSILPWVILAEFAIPIALPWLVRSLGLEPPPP